MKRNNEEKPQPREQSRDSSKKDYGEKTVEINNGIISHKQNGITTNECIQRKPTQKLCPRP